MNRTPNLPDKERTKAFQYTVAAVAGQVGCLTLVIVLAALFGGLWLDDLFNTDRAYFTVGLMVASVPVTIVAMLWVVKKATSRIRTQSNTNSNQSQEETTRGE
jgi:hypothetical protein